MTVSHKVCDRILLVTIDNPPVNALSQIERQGLLDVVRFAETADVDAVVIRGARGTFIAGAEVREFGKPPMEPHLPDVIAELEASAKPIVAAIEGVALGGGLEVALGCHYRVAKVGARLGVPEVTLGVVPGAGGTQRLPRLIDPMIAARMIVYGRPVGHVEALTSSLVDRVADGDVTEAALAFAKEVVGADIGPRRISRQPNRDASSVRAELDQFAVSNRKSVRGAEAPIAAMDLVEVALSLPFEEGMVKERETFLRLRGSDQAAALSHIFFAERMAAKPPEDTMGAQARRIEKVGIVGAGTMGTGIAMNFADSGLPVTIVELSAEALARGMERISSSYLSMEKKGRISAGKAAERTALIRATTEYADLAACDLIIEAAFESLNVKKEIFTRLNAVVKPGALLATNTSYLDVNVIAQFSGRPQDVVGMHYFSPANIMKLMEVVRGKETASDTLVTALAFAKRTGKVSVVSGVCTGFIGNRMLKAYVREAGLLLLEGATPLQIDKALTGFGMAMGPFAVADLTGIDIAYKARKEMAPGSYEPMAVLVHDALVEAGHLGRKTGGGFYLYEPDVRPDTPNPLVAGFMATARMQSGIEQREIADEEIVQRCILALFDEGSLIVNEGIAARAADIDVVFVNGYGFPRYRGGPMYYAKMLGLDNACALIGKFSEGRFGHWWRSAQIPVAE